MDKRENIFCADMKIDPENIKKRVNDILDADLNERKMYMKGKIIKIIGTAAAAAAVFSMTAFAMSPGGQEAIENIISYFQNDKAEQITDIEELNKYNEEIGVSDSNLGYTLTLDNVAVDDNFIHLFTTLRSDDKPFYEGDTADIGNMAAIGIDDGWWINGEILGTGNHHEYDGYFADNYTYKEVRKYNISTMDISDTFKLECVMEKYNDDPKFVKWDEDLKNITEDDKKDVIYISADIDKSKVKVDSVVKEVNKYLPWADSELEKVIFSPFGNQLVIKSKPSENVAPIDCFALYDENGVSLDVLNTGLSMSEQQEYRNSFEFLKADKNTKQLKLIPWKSEDITDYEKAEKENYETKQKIGNYPLIYETSEYGKVVVTDIRFSDGNIQIDYYKDGFVMYDPGFMVMDDNGDNVGGKFESVLYIHTHHDTNSYTAEYRFDYNKKGEPIKAEERIPAQKLREQFTTLGVYKNHLQLDYDNAVTVDLG